MPVIREWCGGHVWAGIGGLHFSGTPNQTPLEIHAHIGNMARTDGQEAMQTGKREGSPPPPNIQPYEVNPKLIATNPHHSAGEEGDERG